MDAQVLMTKYPDGFTIQEMAKELHKRVDWCRKELQLWIALGKAEHAGYGARCVRKGRPERVPVYVCLPEGEG